MSTDGHHELLSAYFDDELTLEERAVVEARLEASAALRRELDEIGVLSELLQAQTRRTAPPELAPSILRRVERELLVDRPLLPAWPAVARAWTAVAASLLVSAAALFAIIHVADHPATRVGERVAQHESTELSDALAMDTFDAPADGAGWADRERAANRIAGVAAERREAIAERHLRRNAALSELRSSVGAAEVPPSAEAAAPALAAAESERGLMAASGGIPAAAPAGEHVVNLKETRRDEALGYFASADNYNYVAVVEVDVPDLSAGMQALTEILVGNSIRTPGPAIEMEKLATARGQVESDKDSAQTAPPTAVYVEATPSQLGGALDQLRQEKLFYKVTYRGPADMQQIEVDGTESLQAENGTRQKLAERTTLAQNVARYKSKQMTADDQGWQQVRELQRKALALKADGRPAAAGAAGQSAPAPGPDGLEAVGAAAKSGDQPAVAEKLRRDELDAAPFSFQLPVQLSRTDYARPVTAGAQRLAPTAPPRSAAAAAWEQHRLEDKAQRHPDEQRDAVQLRVMFVLQSARPAAAEK